MDCTANKSVSVLTECILNRQPGLFIYQSIQIHICLSVSSILPPVSSKLRFRSLERMEW